MRRAASQVQFAKRASVSEAKLAYFAGDFEGCLEICSAVSVRDVATASEVALLRGRAYLRIGKPEEAEAAITEAFDTHGTLDASLTAQMLLATARIRRGQPDQGLAILDAARADSADAHFAIRSEIAFATALGYWAKRDLDAAERQLALVDPRSDIIHARALELQAWCELARGSYHRAADSFVAALLRLDRCHAQDRAIAGIAISMLAILAAELFDRSIAQFVESRARTIEWTSGLATQRFHTLLHLALLHEFAGNTVEAYGCLFSALDVAPTLPFRVVAYTTCSSVARNADEISSAIAYAKRAKETLQSTEFKALVGEEQLSILGVAEQYAYFDVDSAEKLFALYRELAPLDKMLALAGDPRLRAEERFVEGRIAEAGGHRVAAQRAYEDAFAIFKRIGYVRRAVTTALALANLCDDDWYYDYIESELHGVRNWVTTSIHGRAVLAVENPVMETLPRMQKEVVFLVCEGKTNREIARLRNVGEQTVKNMLCKQIFKAFGVSSRAALVSACLRGRM